MEIILNVVYGGNNLAETTTAPIVREVRRMLKKSFYYFDNEAVKQIKLFLFLMVILTSYCDSTGVYQSKYFSKKRSLLQIFVLTIKMVRTQIGRLQTFFLVRISEIY